MANGIDTYEDSEKRRDRKGDTKSECIIAALAAVKPGKVRKIMHWSIEHIVMLNCRYVANDVCYVRYTMESQAFCISLIP